MRWLALVLAVAACGKGNHAKDDAAPPPPPPNDGDPAPACANPVHGTKVELHPFGKVDGSAVLVTAPTGELDRLFVVQQVGKIAIFDQGTLRAEPFLDLSSDNAGPVVFGGEQGLLGLAFHPEFATNGVFFVTYTARNSGDPPNPLRDVLARCTVSAADPDQADPASCADVISIPDYATNHNGGMIEFGSDGFLYWATGDGGGAGDPQRNGQAVVDASPNTHALLGKMLRLDVDHPAPGKLYGIPADNPFASGGGLPEIYMIGLRNAWRWTFDRATGDMWIADVGQNTIEELTVLHPAQQRGANLGWSAYEGTRCFREPCGDGTVPPQIERTHAQGFASITGGQVYRGSCFPDLVGTYFFTDYVKGGLSKATLNADDSVTISDLPGAFPPKGASLHEDARGELYETDTAGNIFQLVAVP